MPQHQRLSQIVLLPEIQLLKIYENHHHHRVQEVEKQSDF